MRQSFPPSLSFFSFKEDQSIKGDICTICPDFCTLAFSAKPSKPTLLKPLSVYTLHGDLAQRLPFFLLRGRSGGTVPERGAFSRRRVGTFRPQDSVARFLQKIRPCGGALAKFRRIARPSFLLPAPAAKGAPGVGAAVGRAFEFQTRGARGGTGAFRLRVHTAFSGRR